MTQAKQLSKATAGRRFRVYDPLTKILRGVVAARSKEAAAEILAARLGMTGHQASLFCHLATVKMVKPVSKAVAK